MAIRSYEVTLTGRTPLLMHWDNLDHAADLERWRADPDNKKLSKAGDDRSPSWGWIGSLYNDGERVVMPSENIQRMMMEGGAMVPVPGANAKKTFKAQSQSGMRCREAFWPMLARGQEIPFAPVEALRSQPEFGLHKYGVTQMGFSLFVKRAKIGQAKHVRVRPRFDEWKIQGIVEVWDDQISEKVLNQILDFGGRYKGLGDWRPGSKTPGSFGMFDALVRPL